MVKLIKYCGNLTPDSPELIIIYSQYVVVLLNKILYATSFLLWNNFIQELIHTGEMSLSSVIQGRC